jgi:chitinase
MRIRIAMLVALLGLLLAGGSAIVVYTASDASAATAYGVAPYLDLSANSSSMLDTAITSAGLKSYTAAFVIGSGCTPIWGDSLGIDSSTVNAKITRAQSEGAKTIISFGGEAGAELAQSCTDTASLTAAYQSVITKYKVDHIDFDIEGAAIADTGSINRRFQAIKTLEANNSGLNISVTIPVLQSGPDYNGTAFLKAAGTSGARIDLINIMTMDYGGAVSDMGAAAISAAKATLGVAQGIWSGFGYGSLGVTPMIGQNDQSGEIFTEADASSLVSFANTNGLGRLAFWSVGRDQPCAAGAGGSASPNCSSISQSNLDFTHIFLGLSGGSSPTSGTSPTAFPSPTSTSGGAGCSAAAWSAGAVYTAGMSVTYSGRSYTAKWWTQGDQPDQNTGDGKPWTDNGICSGTVSSSAPSSSSASPSPTATSTGSYPAWQANHAYKVGDLVSYAGHNYKCIQAHTSMVGWEPPNVPALWQYLS